MTAYVRNLIGTSIALFGSHEKRFVQMNDKGDVGTLTDDNARPDNFEHWRTWERFLVVDGGGGRIALYCSQHRRFLRVRDGTVNGHGGVRDGNSLPDDWDSERFEVVDAGEGKVAFHNPSWNCFVRMSGRKVDALGGPMDADKLPPASEWGAERFLIVPHPVVRPGDYIALYGSHEKRFVQMNDKGDVGTLTDDNVRPDNFEHCARTWERFLVVDGGGGRIALYCSEHRRFVRQIESKVDGLGAQVNKNAHGEWNRGPDQHERFSLVDGGNNLFAFHNAHTNCFIRMSGRKVDALGGPMDADKLPPANEWEAERFLIVHHKPTTANQDFPPDYENKGPISEGWWGETFKAKSKIDGGLYCIKRFKAHALSDKVVIERELAALRALPRHRNILSYNHSTRVNDTFFTVCEFIDAEQLVEEMPAPEHPRKAFAEAKVLAWTQQLLEGLKHLHSASPCIVHRDLHQRNILVKYRAGSDRKVGATIPGSVKIVDVGNAKMLADRDVHAMTNVGGTQCYFSPERISGNPYNEKDDIWAIGVIVTELVTGRFVSKRRVFGHEGGLLATQQCRGPRADLVNEVIQKSIKIGAIVGDILSAESAATRPSAEALLLSHFESAGKGPVPFSFYCPISQEIMSDPVVCSDGHTYERTSIEKWFDSRRPAPATSPSTNLPLANTTLISNHALRSAISEFSA
jgi:serine/threonine protein kinase